MYIHTYKRTIAVYSIKWQSLSCKIIHNSQYL